jgi:hypothetical protein
LVDLFNAKPNIISWVPVLNALNPVMSLSKAYPIRQLGVNCSPAIPTIAALDLYEAPNEIKLYK